MLILSFSAYFVGVTTEGISDVNRAADCNLASSHY